MSLTQREKSLIQSSFKKVVPIADVAAEIFYAKLFEYDPSLKSLFKGSMKKQGQMLMSTLKVAVEGLDDLGAVAEILKGLAVKHLDYGVKVDDYTPVGNALLFALKKGLGADFTPEVKSAWIKVYEIIAEVMRSAAYPQYNANTYVNRKTYHR